MHLTQDGISFQLLYIYITYSNYNRSLKEWKMAGIGSILQHLPTIFFDFSNVLFTLSLNWSFTNLGTSWYTSATSPAIKSSVVKFPRGYRERRPCVSQRTRLDFAEERLERGQGMPRPRVLANLGLVRLPKMDFPDTPGYPPTKLSRTAAFFLDVELFRIRLEQHTLCARTAKYYVKDSTRRCNLCTWLID